MNQSLNRIRTFQPLMLTIAFHLTIFGLMGLTDWSLKPINNAIDNAFTVDIIHPADIESPKIVSKQNSQPNQASESKHFEQLRTAHSSKTTATQPLNSERAESTTQTAPLQAPSPASSATKPNASIEANITKPSHIGGYLNNPKPDYPILSREANEQGTVTLRVTVEPSGLPSIVQIVKSSGYHRLDASAKKTVEQKYHFRPATQLGQPIQSSYLFNIDFKLS